MSIFHQPIDHSQISSIDQVMMFKLNKGRYMPRDAQFLIKSLIKLSNC